MVLVLGLNFLQFSFLKLYNLSYSCNHLYLFIENKFCYYLFFCSFFPGQVLRIQFISRPFFESLPAYQIKTQSSTWLCTKIFYMLFIVSLQSTFSLFEHHLHFILEKKSFVKYIYAKSFLSELYQMKMVREIVSLDQSVISCDVYCFKNNLFFANTLFLE